MNELTKPVNSGFDELFKFHQNVAAAKWPKKSTNPHFKSKYLNLDDLMQILNPILKQSNLILKTSIYRESADNWCVCSEIVNKENKTLNIAMLAIPQNLNAQQIGSFITYARRYTICTICNIVGDDDDDANHATAGVSAQNKNKILTKEKFEIAAQTVLAGKCTTDQIWAKYSETPMEQRFDFVEFLANKENENNK